MKASIVGINVIEVAVCIICKRLMAKTQTNFLFMESDQEIRVCKYCDTG